MESNEMREIAEMLRDHVECANDFQELKDRIINMAKGLEGDADDLDSEEE